MILPAPVAALLTVPALVAIPLFGSDASGYNGTRTVVGAFIVVAVMGLVVVISLAVGRGKDA